MPTIDLIFDDDCPNVIAAREQLLSACINLGLPARWNEWSRTARDTPEHFQRFGSPTILVDGRDITGESLAGVGACCRIYSSARGASGGVPPLEMITTALLGR